ncbi:hypothetical protein KOI35_27490 [Actinoplanes bogorensis]|uniref:Uncharacterized protein n=1 Tax=Paractinoplanes bogorensis TaxID=1610840 RepID=A0ABS5YUY4_9ACTN|nr:hypothetical protein [Actinoplanes bogorensis]MBU2667259.1 hypothetical protein [Actinoplanes bogorensis]
MSAERAARWRRWAGLPVVVALFLAGAVVAATPRAGQTFRVAVVAAPPTIGHSPDPQVAERGGNGRTTADPAASAWLGERAGTTVTTWWHRRIEGDGHRVQAGRELHQVRGPPGRRTGNALS